MATHLRGPGQASNKTTAPALLDALTLAGDVVAHRGCNARAVIDLIEACGAKASIPGQSNLRTRRSVDRRLYRQRNLVERFFNRPKRFRAIATRCHKRAGNFLAAIAPAATGLWIRHYESMT